MGLQKTIEINGKQITLKASAAVPRLYRIKFGRDIFKDLTKVKTAEGDELAALESEFFENIAYIMAKHADSSIPDSVEEWLDSMSVFELYGEFRREILGLLDANNKQNVKSKKKQEQPNVN